MRATSIILAAGLLAPAVVGEGELNGFPANPYDPFCAMSCLRSLYMLMLSCSSMGDTVGMMTMMTSSSCWATNTPYLTSLAWCMQDKCTAFSIPNSALELFWEHEVTGQSSAGVKTVAAKWSFAEALAHSPNPPTNQLTATDEWLNTTSLVAPATYQAQWNALTAVQREFTIENGYGIAMLVTGVGAPLLLTLLSHIPLLRRLKPRLIWPRPFRLPHLLGLAPTLGQILAIAAFLVLNVVLSAVGYRSRQPNAWYASTHEEILAYLLFRTGNYAYILAPLLFLFAARNNPLLRIANWSQTTYLLLHRWLARLFTLYAVLHSILAVVLYKAQGRYEEAVSAPYWIWGIVATLCAVVLSCGSGVWVRRRGYEAWLLSHIVLSVVLVVACWYHAYDLYAFLGGYLDWIYAIAAVWFFDRAARVVRVLFVGARRATVTQLGEHYLRIDVPGVRWGCVPGQHVYAFFPTLSGVRPWENHPFSVIPTAMLTARAAARMGSSDEEAGGEVLREGKSSEEGKQSVPVVASRAAAAAKRASSAGVTLYVKRATGLTKALRAGKGVLTLLEGPYTSNPSSAVLRCDRVLLIAGGIGITSILPFALQHLNVKLAWSLREEARCLVKDLGDILEGVGERDERIGRRLDVDELVAEEVAAWWFRGRRGFVRG